MRLDIQSIPKFVINLDKRPERLEALKEELPYLFKDPSFERFSGLLFPEKGRKAGMKGCGESHKAIIRIAKERGYPNVLIMEDDMIFQAKERTLEHVEKCFNNIPNGYDILLGGVYQAANMTESNEYWNNINYFSSSHFYIMRDTVYDTVLNEYNADEKHIDRYYAASNIRCYVPKLMFAIQSIGYSDNVNANINYSHMLEKNGIKLL